MFSFCEENKCNSIICRQLVKNVIQKHSNRPEKRQWNRRKNKLCLTNHERNFDDILTKFWRNFNKIQLASFSAFASRVVICAAKWRLFDDSRLFDEILTKFWRLFDDLTTFWRNVDGILTKFWRNIDDIWKSSFASFQAFASKVVSRQKVVKKSSSRQNFVKISSKFHQIFVKIPYAQNFRVYPTQI